MNSARLACQAQGIAYVWRIVGTDVPRAWRARPAVVPSIHRSFDAVHDIDTFTRSEALHREGLYLQAFDASQAAGPLRTWTGTRAKVLGARLASVLGGRRLGGWLITTAFRADPMSGEAKLYFAYHLAYRRGPLVTARWLLRQGELSGAPPRMLSDWRALHARVLSELRDFAAAEEWLRRAEEPLDAPRAWLEVERSATLDNQDRLDEALACAERALEIRPNYRPALQCRAALLVKAGRREEAVAVLKAGGELLECGDLDLIRGAVLIDLAQYGEAIGALERAIARWPLCDQTLAVTLAAQLETACYQDGQPERAAEFARLVGGEFHERFAERLTSATLQGRRVALRLAHVQQQIDTCAPATLTMIGRYWSRPVDHIELVEQICYDGTPYHAQRKWAEENGFAVRTFTVSAESARALIDQGLPFALMTAGPGWSHLQAVAGYDDYRGTLLVRNPTTALLSEYLLEQTLDSNRFTGPQGMVLVPREEASRLERVELPDVEFRDRLYGIDVALLRYDRAAAGRLLQEQRDAAPNHDLTIHARRILARYDNDWEALLQCAEQLAARFPEDPLGAVERYFCLRELGRREQYLDVLTAAEAKFPWDVHLKVLLARELASDGRRWPEVERLLRTVLRWQPTNADALDLLGNLRWRQLRRDEALPHCRWAACLEDKKEHWSTNYFRAAWDHQRAPEALAFLEDRVRRYGARSSGPGMTLAWAWQQLGQPARGLEVLRAALELRPEDGELLLFAAQSFADQHCRAESDQCLERARDRASAANWHRAAADVAQRRGDVEAAAQHWEAVLEAAPLDSIAYNELALLLRDSQGYEAAVERLRAAVERFPFHYRLQQVLIEFLGGAKPDEHLDAVRRLLEQHPVDAWAHREAAVALLASGQLAEAEAEAELGLQLDPGSATSWSIRGQVRSVALRLDEARDDLLQALRCDPDWTPAINRAYELARSAEERRETLNVLYDELFQHGIVGVGIEGYAHYGREALSDEELRDRLGRLNAARPDVWQTWIVLAEALLDQRRLDEALAIAREAAERFPHLPRAWQLLAAVQAARGERALEIEALERARRLPAATNDAARTLAGLREQEGDLPAAREVLEAALAQNPRDAQAAALLALIVRKCGEPNSALKLIRRALQLEPHYAWAWEQYEQWAQETDNPQQALEAARELVTRRTGDPESWITLARRLRSPDEQEARLSALDRALAIAPRSIDARQLKAYTLADLGRADQALQLAEADVWGGILPAPLRATAAEIVAAGNLTAGIERLEALVRDEPRYTWAWRQLTDWYRIAERPDDYLRAAQRWTSTISPGDAIGWGHLGTAYEACAKPDQARAAFEQALNLDPSYVYAGLSLFDLQIARGDWAEAAATLDRVRDDDPGGILAARRLRLATRRGDWPAAEAQLAVLCRLPSADPSIVSTCVQDLRAAGFLQRSHPMLRSMLLEPSPTPLVVALAIDSYSTRAQAGAALAKWRTAPPVWQAAARHWMEGLIAAGDARSFKRYWRRLRRRFQADTQTWATAGRALIVLVNVAKAESWLRQYVRRPDVEPWMLSVLAHAQWLQRRSRRVEHTTAYAIRLAPDHSAADLWAFRAAALLSLGDPAQAAQCVAQARAVAGRDVLSDCRAIVAIVEATAAEIESTSERRSYWSARRRYWGRLEAWEPAMRGHQVLQRLAQRGLCHVARAHGNWLAAGYHWLQESLNLRLT